MEDPQQSNARDRHLPPATVPAAIETSTESAWVEFEQLQALHAARFAVTEIVGGPDVQETCASAAEAAPDAAADLTVDALMLLARRNNRVCPKPEQWKELHQLLLRQRSVVQKKPRPPVAASSWAMVSAMEKRLVLREQIEWAAEHGALALVRDFLGQLAEGKWHHVGE